MKFKLIFTLIVLVLFTGMLRAQEKRTISVEWEQPRTVKIDGVERKVPHIPNQGFDFNKPMVQWQELLNAKNNYSIKIESIRTGQPNPDELKFINYENLEIPADLEVDMKITRSRDEKLAVVVFFPFVNQGGQIKRVTGMDVSITSLGAQSVLPAKDFAASSVLASGTWHKIGLTKNGIYKIDKAFLDNNGISTSGVDPNDVHVFGNGEGMLPTDNSIERTDDLAQNAVKVVGGGDGEFGPNDYILFYGRGPHQWKKAGILYQHNTHLYSEVSNYFITVNASIPAKQISNVGLSNDPATHQVNTTEYLGHYGPENFNLLKAGQRWYADLFDTELTKTYNFSVPNLVTSEAIDITYAFANNSRDSANEYRFELNGALINDNPSLGSVSKDYLRASFYRQATSNSSSLSFKFTVDRISPDVQTYLDFITFHAVRSLNFYGDQMLFFDEESVGGGNVAEFTLNTAGVDVSIWDVTDWQNPGNVNYTKQGINGIFKVNTDAQRIFMAFRNSNFLTPTYSGVVSNQNLHGLPQADYLIVSPVQFFGEATRLANLHRSNGLEVHVVTQEQIYNEFGSGMQDATAIRWFAKMFYDRGLDNNSKMPKYLLLFGDGIFDPKGRVTGGNFVLTYQVAASENYTSALVADDYFGYLDDNEGFGLADKLDVGVGRLLISSNQIAKEQVNKIEHYMKNGSNFYSNPGDCDCPVEKTKNTFGDWRTKYVQIADDEQDDGKFVYLDAEPQVEIVDGYRREMNADKIYLDAYEQISTAGGQRYPQVNEAINDRMRRGVLVMNYVGHGGEVGVAEERVITVPQIQAWKNAANLPLMISATCEFTKFDDPDRVSAGEWASLNANGGAIALMTTTRSVYIGTNRRVMESFYKRVFERDSDSLPKPFGEVIRQTKNLMVGFDENARSFTLIGDPALRIAMPRERMVLDSVYREGSTGKNDTIRALDKITVVGHVEDVFGNTLNGFNGIASPTLYDKPKTFFTLGQDSESPVIPFELQKNALYKGQATVSNGYFKMTFIVPKDIDYNLGQGKLSMYAHNFQTDAMGYSDSVIVGGVNPNGLEDDRGPDIELYMNDFDFVSGGLTDENPTLIAKLFDENGINAVGNGIGHDITAILDGKTGEPFVLNEYYLSDLDTYQSGEVRFLLSNLEPGRHTLTFKAWDVNNNSSEATIEFIVKEQEKPELMHVLNYPNPFTTNTSFFFEHNQVNSGLETQIQIFTISGTLVKTINQLVNTSGFRSEGIQWDGKDDFGDQLAKGVYVYRLSIRTESGEMAEEWEKLVILK